MILLTVVCSMTFYSVLEMLVCFCMTMCADFCVTLLVLILCGVTSVFHPHCPIKVEASVSLAEGGGGRAGLLQSGLITAELC